MDGTRVARVTQSPRPKSILDFFIISSSIPLLLRPKGQNKISTQAPTVRDRHIMAAVQVQLQPDIQYHPDYSKFLDRSKKRLERETLTTTLPPGLPKHLSSSFVWDGNKIQGRDDWVVALTDGHLEEVDRALSHFKGKFIHQRDAARAKV
jgi:hypothetical protein